MILKSESLARAYQMYKIRRADVMNESRNLWNIPTIHQSAFAEYYMVQYTPQMVESYVHAGILTLKSGRRIPAFFHDCTRNDVINSGFAIWISIRTPQPEYELPSIALIQPVGWMKKSNIIKLREY